MILSGITIYNSYDTFLVKMESIFESRDRYV